MFSVSLWSTEIQKDQSEDIKAIKNVIVNSYIKGVITEGNVELAKKGWHQDCDIVTLNQGNLKRFPASYLIERLNDKPGPIETDVKYNFKKVMVTGYAAVAVIKIFYKDKPKYMDYISLYKFPDGWKIVTKIYYTYNREHI
jgi:hypothetical protein